ncbi:MAG: hypothetical protein ACRCUH_12965, partial [Shewanella sp.]
LDTSPLIIPAHSSLNNFTQQFHARMKLAKKNSRKDEVSEKKGKNCVVISSTFNSLMAVLQS